MNVRILKMYSFLFCAHFLIFGELNLRQRTDIQELEYYSYFDDNNNNIMLRLNLLA